MLLTLTSVLFLLLLSAFFSASETALTAASPSLMHQLEQTGDRSAKRVNRLLANTDRLLGTILLGNTLVNILASALTTSALIVLFGEAGVLYATISLTTMILIFGEIMPKAYAFRNANRVALLAARPISALVLALGPLTQTIAIGVRSVLRLFGVDTSGDRLAPSAEELRGAIELHAGSTDIQDEKAMLHSILDLGEVVVGEVMTHRRNVTMIDADQPPETVVAEVLASPFTRIPLWRDDPDNIIGVIHAKALLRAVHGEDTPLHQIDIVSLAAPPWFVPDSTTLLDQLHAFRRRHEHFALVVDEYGSFLGIVTLEDILEEIVGDIADEHDMAVPGVVRQADGTITVQGSVTIRDLNREFAWSLPDDEAVTIAGLVLHLARRIPEVGQEFDLDGFRFEVLRRHGNQITTIRISPPAAAKDPNPEDTPR